MNKIQFSNSLGVILKNKFGILYYFLSWEEFDRMRRK